MRGPNSYAGVVKTRIAGGCIYTLSCPSSCAQSIVLPISRWCGRHNWVFALTALAQQPKVKRMGVLCMQAGVVNTSDLLYSSGRKLYEGSVRFIDTQFRHSRGPFYASRARFALDRFQCKGVISPSLRTQKCPELVLFCQLYKKCEFFNISRSGQH